MKSDRLPLSEGVQVHRNPINMKNYSLPGGGGYKGKKEKFRARAGLTKRKEQRMGLLVEEGGYLLTPARIKRKRGASIGQEEKKTKKNLFPRKISPGDSRRKGGKM